MSKRRNWNIGVLSGGCFGAFFLLFWSTITLIFDGRTGSGIYHQLRTLGFDQVEGRVMSSRVETSLGSDSDTFTPIVSYKYQVDGEMFQGTRSAAE